MQQPVSPPRAHTGLRECGSPSTDRWGSREALDEAEKMTGEHTVCQGYILQSRH